MTYLTRHWSFDPMLVIIAATAAAHAIGLARLNARSRPESARRRNRRSLYFYGALAVLALTISSPVDYWASDYLYVHMIEHVLLAFAFPVLLVAGAPWVPLWHVLSVRPRRAVGRFLYLDRRAGGLRAVGRFIRRPDVAVVSFNAVMVLWHLPGPFDYGETHPLAHVWLMHASFIVTGVLFWLQIVPSHPIRPAQSPVWQAGAILTTNVIMTILAMAMSFLSSANWYSVYAHVPGVTLAPFADQQIGAAILWVCGDFWALPALLICIRRAISLEGSFAAALDRAIHARAERDVFSRL